MEHLKLYENFTNSDFLLNIVKKQALHLNKPDMIELAISKGFDLEKHKQMLISYSKNNCLHSAIEMLDIQYHQVLVDTTTGLYYDGENLKTLQLNTLINLIEFSCHNNKLTSLEGVKKLTKLLWLYCSNNQLISLEPIKNLTNLEKLYYQNNQLTSLESIKNLEKLIELNCNDNQLTSLKGVENLINLKELICHKNNLTSLKGIENLIDLEYLYCRNNQLTSLKGIENLINLKELDCSNNNFPSELQSFGNDISKWQEYYRNN